MTSFVEHNKYIKIESKKYEVWAARILEYEQYKYPDDLEMVSKLIVNNLELKFCPSKYREMNFGNKLLGHCYHATQALYYFFADANLKVMCAKCKVVDAHWWLQDGDKIIDITAPQYDSLEVDPPYDKGKESKWYGWKYRPHVKSLKLMQLAQPTAKLYFKQYREKPKKSY